MACTRLMKRGREGQIIGLPHFEQSKKPEPKRFETFSDHRPIHHFQAGSRQSGTVPSHWITDRGSWADSRGQRDA